ncbi:hypothetical protein PVAP13_6NG116006 [Panicum virgatum]|uniref:Uncharacterized protein n=1 Tax=Panicum virgatum TaxID=38727 RepID=A0A8T0QZB7_PANVG|nr:hypothetical protein PVAP13_6NG116006 [Panicum virgatum]
MLSAEQPQRSHGPDARSTASVARIHVEGGAARLGSPAQRGSMASAVWHGPGSRRGFPARRVADPQRGADQGGAWHGRAAWMQGGCVDARSPREPEGRGLLVATEMLGRWRMLVAGSCLQLQRLASTAGL